MSSTLRVNELQNLNGTSAMAIHNSGLILPKIPILQVNATDIDQSLSAGTNTKIQWENVEIDTIGGWDSSNHRYTPTVAGYYLMGGVVRYNFPSDVEYVILSINKNGSTVDAEDLRTQYNHGSDTIDNGSYPMPTGYMFMNGTSDYVEIYTSSDETATIHDSAIPKSYFFSQLVHAT